MPNTTRGSVAKRWSDLHGDMQSQAEMIWPPHGIRLCAV